MSEEIVGVRALRFLLVSTMVCPVLVFSTPAAYSEPAQGPSRIGDTIPRPDLSALEPAVADQIEEAITWLGPRIGDDGHEAAEAAGELAKLFHAYDLTASARAAYDRAIALDPGSFEWTYLAAILEHSSGGLQRAAELYLQAIMLNPDHWPARVRLAEIRLEDGKLQEARATIAPVHGTAASSPAVLALLGRIALAARRYEDARQLLSRALAAEPRADRLHYPLALAYRGLGDLEQAKAHLAERGDIGVRPPDPLVDELSDLVAGERVFLLRGHAAFRAGDYQAAAEAFALAIDARPESARAHVNLGAALGLMHRTEAAIDAFRRALELDPMNPTAHFNLGRLLFEGGSVDEALPHLHVARQARPDDSQTSILLGRALRQSGQLEEAAAHYDEIIGKSPDLEDAWLGAARVRLDLGRLEVAGEILEAAASKIPTSGRIARELAWFLAAAPDLSLRDGSRALGLAEKVFSAQKSARNAEVLAASFAEIGRCDEASDLQRKAAEATADEHLRSRRLRVLESYLQQRPCRLAGSLP